METALDDKQFELALNSADEGMEIAPQNRDKLAHLCCHEFMGIVQVEISLADIKTAYDIGMNQKAREFADRK
jgi:hypothetical protein